MLGYHKFSHHCIQFSIPPTQTWVVEHKRANKQCNSGIQNCPLTKGWICAESSIKLTVLSSWAKVFTHGKTESNDNAEENHKALNRSNHTGWNCFADAMLSSYQQGSIIQSFLLESGSGQNPTFIFGECPLGKRTTVYPQTRYKWGTLDFFASIRISVTSKGDTMQDHVVDWRQACWQHERCRVKITLKPKR